MKDLKQQQPPLMVIDGAPPINIGKLLTHTQLSTTTYFSLCVRLQIPICGENVWNATRRGARIY